MKSSLGGIQDASKQMPRKGLSCKLQLTLFWEKRVWDFADRNMHR